MAKQEMKTAQDLTLKDTIYSIKGKDIVQHKIFAIADLGKDGIRINLEKKVNIIAAKDSNCCFNAGLDYYFDRKSILPQLITVQEQRVERIQRDLELATGYLKELKQEQRDSKK